MEGRNELINIGTANIFSIAVFLVTALVTIPLFALITGSDEIKKMITDAVELPLTNRLLIIPILVCGIILHELIHGITWSLFAKKKFKSISFGVIWKKLTPYCHCDEPLIKKAYLLGSLMPMIVLGIVPILISFFIPSFLLLLFGIIFTCAASGDIMVSWRIRKEKDSVMLQDHPTECGYIVRE